MRRASATRPPSSLRALLKARLGTLNARVAVNGVVAKPEAPGASHLDLASVNTDVAELLTLIAGLRQSLVIMAGWCGDTPRLAFSRPGW
jgi:hypothetical protein